MLIARLEVLGEVDARGAIRFDVDQDSTARGMDGTPVDVVMENFSRTGFLFSGIVDFPVGTLVSIGLSGAGAREAQVVRREGDQHGCVFLVPLLQRELAVAFRGQDDVLAELEAELARRAVREPEQRPQPPLSRWTRLWVALRRPFCR